MVPEHHTPPSPDPAGPGTESKLAHPFSPSPEPWELNDLSKNSICVCKPGPNGHQLLLAEFPLFTGSSLEDLLPENETRSNARLFLAAPRMLIVLRALSLLGFFPESDAPKVIDQNETIRTIRDEAIEILRELEGGAQ